MPAIYAPALILAILSLGGCSDLPRDPESTVHLIREEGAIRVGMVAGVDSDPATERQLAAAARKLGVNISRSTGPGERLLGELEDGKLDLVYGEFPADSPWSRKVHLGKPPGWRADPPPALAVPRFAFRNGENGWIMTMERIEP